MTAFKSLKSQQLAIACSCRIKFKRIIISSCCVVNSSIFFFISFSFLSLRLLVHPEFYCFILTLSIRRHNYCRHTSRISHYFFDIILRHVAIRGRNGAINGIDFVSVRIDNGGETQAHTYGERDVRMKRMHRWNRIHSSICKYFSYRIAYIRRTNIKHQPQAPLSKSSKYICMLYVGVCIGFWRAFESLQSSVLFLLLWTAIIPSLAQSLPSRESAFAAMAMMVLEQVTRLFRKTKPSIKKRMKTSCTHGCDNNIYEYWVCTVQCPCTIVHEYSTRKRQNIRSPI